jgi:hypothetical protein
MKLNKIYKSIFSEMINPKERLMKMEINKNYIFVTPSGYYGFVFNKYDVPFNIEQIATSQSKLDLQSIVKAENLCKLTNKLVLLKGVGLVNIFTNGNRKIYVNQKYLQYFEDYTEFYQEKDLGIITAVEYGNIVGAIIPVRNMEGDNE